MTASVIVDINITEPVRYEDYRKLAELNRIRRGQGVATSNCNFQHGGDRRRLIQFPYV